MCTVVSRLLLTGGAHGHGAEASTFRTHSPEHLYAGTRDSKVPRAESTLTRRVCDFAGSV